MAKSVKKLKSLSEIKRKAYRGLRVDIAKQTGLSKYDVNNVFSGRSKNPIYVTKVRKAGGLLLAKHQAELENIQS